MNNQCIHGSSGRYKIKGSINNLKIKIIFKEVIESSWNSQIFQPSDITEDTEKEFVWGDCFQTYLNRIHCDTCKLFGDRNDLIDEIKESTNDIFFWCCCEHYGLSYKDNGFLNKHENRADENIISTRKVINYNNFLTEFLVKKNIVNYFPLKKTNSFNNFYNCRCKTLLIFVNIQSFGKKRRELLAILKFDLNTSILIVQPDFNKTAKEAGYEFFDENRKIKYKYWILSSIKYQFYKQNSFKTGLSRSIYTNIRVHKNSYSVISIFGEIKSAKNLYTNPNNVFIRYKIYSTSSGRLFENKICDNNGVTQTSKNKNDIFVFNHLFEYEFQIESDLYFNLPCLFFEIISIKFGGIVNLEGYGKMDLPLKSGSYSIDILYNDVSSSQLKKFFLKSDGNLINWFAIQKYSHRNKVLNLLGVKTGFKGKVLIEINVIKTKKSML